MQRNIFEDALITASPVPPLHPDGLRKSVTTVAGKHGFVIEREEKPLDSTSKISFTMLVSCDPKYESREAAEAAMKALVDYKWVSHFLCPWRDFARLYPISLPVGQSMEVKLNVEHALSENGPFFHRFSVTPPKPEEKNATTHEIEEAARFIDNPDPAYMLHENVLAEWDRSCLQLGYTGDVRARAMISARGWATVLDELTPGSICCLTIGEGGQK